MTARALVGLAGLQALYLIVGSCLLWALCGRRSWRANGQLAGLAYLLGVAALGIVWTLLLVAGVPFGGVTILASAAAVALVSLVVDRWRGGPRPTRAQARALTWFSLVAATGIALTAVFLEALFRASRLQGLYAFDAWAFWVPKAIAIYSFGGLDEQFFVQLDGPTYPPLVPIVDAAAFHAMGSADVVTLHVQYWFFAVGFAAAAAGLLWRHVPSWILWPLLVFTLLLPRTAGHLVTPQADFLLQFFFCVAVLLAALWLLEGSTWYLATATLLLGAAVLTKREGILLAAILLFALAVASLDRWRRTWPRIGVSALVVIAVGLPWRLWYRSHDISGEAPTSFEASRERVYDAFRLALEVFFDPALWSVLTLVAVAAVVLAAIWGDRRLAVFFGCVFVLIVFGGTWITAAFPEIPVTAEEAVNPIVRYTASAVLVAGIASPLLLAGVWARAGSHERQVG